MGDNKYYLRFDIPDDGVEYKKYFSLISDIISGFYNFKKEILKTFNSDIDLEILVEDIEKGSLKVDFKEKLKNKNQDLEEQKENKILPILRKCDIKLINNMSLGLSPGEITNNLLNDLEEDVKILSELKEMQNMQEYLFIQKLDKNKLLSSINLIAYGSSFLNDKVYYSPTKNKNDEIQVKGMKVTEHNISYEVPTEEEKNNGVVDIKTTTEFYKFIAVVYKKNNKWRFTECDNSEEFSSPVLDENFVNKVLSSEIVLSPSDIYKVSVKTKTIIKNKKLEKEREILEFIEKIETIL